MKRTIAVLLVLTCLLAGSAFCSTQVYFSPDGGCTEAIVSQINKAMSSLDIAMYSLSSRPIASAIIAAKNKGVVVKILLDKGQAKAGYTSARYLAGNGIDIRYDQGSGLMHNKFAMIDRKVLITGSFNWTAAAEKKNRENLLVMDDQTVIQMYIDEFEKLWERGR